MGVSFYGFDGRRPDPRAPGYGTIVELDHTDPRRVDLCQDNAKAVLALLGFSPGEDGLVGRVPVPEARRAVMRARARLPRMAGQLCRPVSVEYGAPRDRGDGVVDLRPVRCVGGGLDEAGLAARVERLAVLVDALCELGATEIAWD